MFKRWDIGRAAVVVEEMSNMYIRLVMLLCLLWSGYEDFREQKIRVLPVVLCLVFGASARIYLEMPEFSTLLLDAMPGISCFVMSRAWNHFLGDGDSLIILCVGLMNGVWFCMTFLFWTFACVLAFSMTMLASGKLTRYSQIPCVPFMIIGYIGAWLL